ncbi:alanine--tRNA ligase [Candidatus Cloacimonadaceae bacterium]
MPTSKEIRNSFISFFLEKGHSFVPSSPVIPVDDPTLLFANAGMNQFKSIFLGQREITYPRAVNSQKCIRAGGKHNDLEEVGKDGYHHTFFEMLGNWSFGDYYKPEAISWAWELLTSVWHLPKQNLYATVHDSDQEAFELWKQLTDIAEDHISYHGDKDNFWEMGETGPCGPCSEIHIDRGAQHCDKQHIEGHVCRVNGDCARYIELWNLVFVQYNREEDKSLTPLKHKFVDTGAGLERVTQVLQDKGSNYETDLFMPIIERLVQLSGVAYSQETGMSHRVIADHLRCLCFALADGGFPSNEGRGYVLRRILRRAARHGRLLGFAEPFLHTLVDSVVGLMGHHFTELNGKEDYIKMVLKAEEERFNKTLDTGLEIFNDLCAKLDGKLISGADAFLLYDTYGFPLDLTMLLAEEKGMSVDQAGFNQEMDAQRQRARNASKFGRQNTLDNWIEFSSLSPTEFAGYQETSLDTQIQRWTLDDQGKVVVQLAKTPFYAESGGQVADTGIIVSSSFEIEISEVRKVDDYILHYGTLLKGGIEAKPVRAEINSHRRANTARNHTATHLLHKALRQVLGDYVQQKGSYVHPDYLRFDFTHLQAVNHEQLQLVERIVNEAIRNNLPVDTSIQDIETARKEGAMALFGEKYGEEVRVVKIGVFSSELCGGTHVRATGDIGFFKVLSESSTAAGIRRIEAITGSAAESWVESLQETLTRLANKLHSPMNNLEAKLEMVLEQQRSLENTIAGLQAKAGEALVQDLISTGQLRDNYHLINQQISLDNPDALKALAESLKAKLNATLALLFNVYENRLNIVCIVSSDLLGRFHAGKLVAALAARLDGKGGGKPDLAMAGGKAIDKLSEVMAQVPELLETL